jgi:hypothetical protein
MDVCHIELLFLIGIEHAALAPASAGRSQPGPILVFRIVTKNRKARRCQVFVVPLAVQESTTGSLILAPLSAMRVTAIEGASCPPDCLTRRALSPELRDLYSWPTVDPSALPETRRTIYLRREQAIRQYLEDRSLALIESATGIRRAQLYRLLARCIAPHDDGRIQGFRALVPHIRTHDYVRTRPTQPGIPGKRGGAAGAIRQLLARYDALTEFLQRQIQLHKVYFGTRGELRGLHATHREFLNRCRHRPHGRKPDICEGCARLGSAARPATSPATGAGFTFAGYASVRGGRIRRA